MKPNDKNVKLFLNIKIFSIFNSQQETQDNYNEEYSLNDLIAFDMETIEQQIFISKEISDRFFQIIHSSLPNGSIMLQIIDVSKKILLDKENQKSNL